MDRPKRAASKVTDYRKYHLSGDLDKVLEGKVTQAIGNWEHQDNMAALGENATADEIRQALEAQQKEEEQRQSELQKALLRNQFEAGGIEKTTVGDCNATSQRGQGKDDARA